MEPSVLTPLADVQGKPGNSIATTVISLRPTQIVYIRHAHDVNAKVLEEAYAERQNELAHIRRRERRHRNKYGSNNVQVTQNQSEDDINLEMEAKFSLDTPLSHLGAQQAEMTAEQLIARYGVPDVILCSPYLRTRQTAFYLEMVCRRAIKQTDTSPAVYVDTQLSKFIFEKERHRARRFIRRDTLEYKPPLDEEKDDFKDRIYSHIKSQESEVKQIRVPITTDPSTNTSKNYVVWCVTHAIAVSVCADYCRKRRRMGPITEKVKACGWVEVRSGDSTCT